LRSGVAAPGEQDATVRIGILGSGLMGGKLGTLLARAGHEVVFSYARSQAKLKRLARIAGANALAGMPAQAARGADALLLAVHWSRFPDVLQQRAIFRARSSSAARCR
jgi:8-hydroxy-5-deazaflavin:NADPH oxidoreductase